MKEHIAALVTLGLQTISIILGPATHGGAAGIRKLTERRHVEDNMKFVALLLAAVVLISGCATVGRRIDPVAVQQLQVGHTTKEQVVALLGSPDSMTQMGTGGAMWQYAFVRATAKASSFIPVVGAFAGGTDMQSQSLMLTFGADGVLTDYVNSVSGADVGTGLNAAPGANLDEVETGKRAR
jgi:outer membrane protein assembly factor BamE (lipoprotein component of BamABCDE complex)